MLGALLIVTSSESLLFQYERMWRQGAITHTRCQTDASHRTPFTAKGGTLCRATLTIPSGGPNASGSHQSSARTSAADTYKYRITLSAPGNYRRQRSRKYHSPTQRLPLPTMTYVLQQGSYGVKLNLAPVRFQQLQAVGTKWLSRQINLLQDLRETDFPEQAEKNKYCSQQVLPRSLPRSLGAERRRGYVPGHRASPPAWGASRPLLRRWRRSSAGPSAGKAAAPVHGPAAPPSVSGRTSSCFWSGQSNRPADERSSDTLSCSSDRTLPGHPCGELRQNPGINESSLAGRHSSTYAFQNHNTLHVWGLGGVFYCYLQWIYKTSLKPEVHRFKSDIIDGTRHQYRERQETSKGLSKIEYGGDVDQKM